MKKNIKKVAKNKVKNVKSEFMKCPCGNCGAIGNDLDLLLATCQNRQYSYNNF